MIDIIISAVIGCLVGVTIMCCLIVAGKSDREGDNK